MTEILKEIISDTELYACPIKEYIKVLPFAKALNILRMDVEAMQHSFITSMHKEMINLMLQRQTTAEYIIMTPNFCAELFTWEQYMMHKRYIINKLVGRYTLDGKRCEDFSVIENTANRRLYRLAKGEKDSYMIFIWNREPNLIKPFVADERLPLTHPDAVQWYFERNSPAYKELVEFYSKRNVVRRG